MAEPTSRRSRTHIEPTTEPEKLLLLLLLLLFIISKHLLLFPRNHSRSQLLSLQDLMMVMLLLRRRGRRLRVANHQLSDAVCGGSRGGRHVGVHSAGERVILLLMVVLLKNRGWNRLKSLRTNIGCEFFFCIVEFDLDLTEFVLEDGD